MALKSQVKYTEFGRFLKEKREAKYRSAREFTGSVKIDVSYPQYSRYESGDQLPGLPLTLTLCGIFDVPPLETLLQWNRAQFSGESPEQKTVLADLERLLLNQESAGLSSFDVDLDKVVVFNRSHLEIFLKHPSYRDVFTYINALHPEQISLERMARALNLERALVEGMLENLERLGVVLKEKGLYRAAKRNFYFPDDADFFELRNKNMQHDFDLIMNRIRFEDVKEKRAYRGMITREFTSNQIQWITRQSEKLLAQSMALPEDEGGEAIYSVLTLVGERFRIN